MDLKLISGLVHKGIAWLIDGGVNAQYKADFERVAQLYAECCVKVIHLNI